MADDDVVQDVDDTDGAIAIETGDDDGSDAAAPDPDYIQKVLDGTEALVKLSEAAAIVADAEEALAVIEPIGGVLSVVTMVLGAWDALELPERTCGYQGLCYGLMYAALGVGDPQPNPGWPGSDAAPNGSKKFLEGIAAAKARLAEGQAGVKRKNFLLLATAKHDPKTVINDLWQHAISDDDHLLRMFTIEWPNVGPNG